MAGQITIRAAKPADRQSLIELMRRASLANPEDRDALLAHPEVIDIPVSHLSPAATCVAELDGVPAGFATVLPRDDGDAELDGLFVAPHLWRSGVGRALVARSAELARLIGARHLHVIANGAALDFYHAVGFTDFGSAQTQFGPAITMRMPL